MRHPSLTRCLILTLSLFLLVAAAPPPRGHHGKAKPASLEAIRRAVEQLGDESFEVRQQAQRRLLAFGKPALPLLKEATKSKDAEVSRAARKLLEGIWKQEWPHAEVHVVGLYESRGRNAVVEVRRLQKPVVLVLCAYESVTWEVREAKGANVVRVIASGYHRQRVVGVVAPVST